MQPRYFSGGLLTNSMRVVRFQSRLPADPYSVIYASKKYAEIHRIHLRLISLPSEPARPMQQTGIIRYIQCQVS